MESYLVYLISIVAFLITSVGMYLVSNDKKKNKLNVIFLRNVIPGIVVGIFIFVIFKFKDSPAFNAEPMMTGNYFD